MVMDNTKIYHKIKNKSMIVKTIKKDHKKKLMKDVKLFSKRKKKKGDDMVMNNTKKYQKMKNKRLLSIEKNIIK